jgi:DNA-binding NarL/FixJ family response regulator
MSVKHVILVEDDPDDRDLFHLFYEERADIKLLPTLENGTDLIDYLHSLSQNDRLPDLIVLDQNMPKMNGKQTLAFLKSNSRFANIQTVIYSTYTDTNLIRECLRLGAGMVAIKPINHSGYQKMMDDFLGLLQA